MLGIRLVIVLKEFKMEKEKQKSLEIGCACVNKQDLTIPRIDGYVCKFKGKCEEKLDFKLYCVCKRMYSE